MQSAFGTALKEWRNRRRLSQLELGLAADVSSRHISFLETGRANPSRSMVLHLCKFLDLPNGARNVLLNSAGFAPQYESRNFDDAEMLHIRSALEHMLERHEPYPAMVFDRHWVVTMLNRPCAALLAAVGISHGDSLLDAMTGGRVREALENWTTVARHTVSRLRTESAHLGGDPVLDAHAEKLTALLEDADDGPAIGAGAIVPAIYRAGGLRLSLFSTIAQFGSAEDIALSEMKIELMFPADGATHDTLLAMEQSPGFK